MPLDITREQVAALAARTFRSPSEFCRVFLADWFPTPMPWVHRGLLALLQNKTDFLLDFGKEQWRDGEGEWTPAHLDKILTNFLEEGTGKPIFRLDVSDPEHPVLVIDAKQHLTIIMPRGSSKTTVVNASNLMDIVFQNEDFFLYISESAPHAERQLGTIKHELEDNEGLPNNELLNLVFGSHRPPRQSSLQWRENYIETLKKIMVGAVGSGGQVRGFGKHAKRPGKIVYDDIEDEESVKSDTQREAKRIWFFRAARPAKRKHTGRDIVIGTLLHTDAILNRCIKSREFTAVRFGAIDRQGDALWEWWMSLEDIEEAKQAAAEVGELSGFYMEYMSQIQDDESRMFPENKLVYVLKGKELFVAISEVMDPAISAERRAAQCAFAIAGIERGGHKHILDFYGEIGMDPAAQIEKYFDLHFKWMTHLTPECQKHGIEAMAFQRALIPLVRMKQVEYSRTYGTAAYFEVLPIFHGKVAKETRVQGILKPLLWGGHLTFQERWGTLHTQFTDWPNGLKDGPDVCAMAVAMLDPYVTLGLGEEGQQNLEQDTLPPLTLAFRRAP